jgi:23S rRNA (cytidine1920-2'-O)/16S rRNA (cytidine1409-2'-O)-methyltransferase
VCLVKPQFEVGKEHVEKGGLVTDPRKHQQVIQKMQSSAESLGYTVLGVIDSPILGAEGNKEFFLGLAVSNQSG